MAKIAEATAIAVTHRAKEGRAGDFTESDAVRAAMEKAAADAHKAGAKPDAVRKAIHDARSKAKR